MRFKSAAILFLVALATRVTADLSPGEVSDGACLSYSELIGHLSRGLNTAPLLIPNSYYVPTASKAAYRNNAEALLGRLATDQWELNSMNILLSCGPDCSTIETTGFPDNPGPPKFNQICTPKLSQGFTLDKMLGECTGLPGTRPDGSAYTTPSALYTNISQALVWVNDDATAVLIYRCLPDNTKAKIGWFCLEQRRWVLLIIK